MADHMYYKEKSFAFGVADGGLACRAIQSGYWCP
jgi:hypothetical protein